MPPVELTTEALADLREAAVWFDEQAPGWGERFTLAIDELLPVIAERPGSFPKVYRNLRRARPKQFGKYGVFFRVTESKIYVVGIIHLSRHPRTWKRRA